ncbi:MAG: ABC transporter permease [Clostridiales bacterium]|nr:ABC transporter permease [Clostridiales bacterium]
MSKNKGQSITKALFRFGNRSGSQICLTTFLLALGFVGTVFVALFSSFAGAFGFNKYTRPKTKVVIVNPPASYIEYEDKYIDTQGNIFHETWDAPYDFLQISDYFKEHGAGIAYVFPEDFDETVKEGHTAEVLMYYRTDTLDYRNISEQFTDTYLEGYENYLGARFNLNYTPSDSWEIIRDDVPTDGNLPWDVRFSRGMANTFIPILLFIAILYTAMSIGSESISGQKERGTFSRILLTPVPRKDLVFAFTRGVFTSSFIPAVIILIITFAIPYYTYGSGVAPALLLTFSLTLFIASLTVMISIMNDTVTSAQTAFLPIFFILISVAVTCINGESDHGSFYNYLPVYGQFYGLGDAFNGFSDLPSAIVCSVLTTLLGIGMMAVSTKLLKLERFTVSIASGDDESKSKTPVARVLNNIITFLDVIFYPLVVLSVFQLLAMIPVAVAYTSNPLYSDFISGLQYVNGISEIFAKTADIVNIFMTDARFLALMSISYLLIIIAFIIKVKGAANLGLSLNNFKRNYLYGIALGTVMIAVVFALLVITGRARPEGFGIASDKVPAFVFSVLMWIPQGAAEEVMFRGYMIPKIKKMIGTPAAVIISSLLFAVFHSLNAGFSVLALINIFLMAVLFALIYIRSGSLLITCAAHTMWNMLQGNIFGLSVSGNSSMPSLISTDYTGSAFGPEGTVEATIVIALALVVFVIISLSKKRSSPKAS